MAVAPLIAEGRQVNHHCMNCAMVEMVESEEEKTMMGFTPEQRDEINNLMKGDDGRS